MAAAVVSVLATGIWTTVDLAGLAGSDANRTGVALGRAAEPGDTVVVYGGRSEIVLVSGMSSPYEHLWSLPMRTLDPDLTELQAVLSGPEAPTWFVMWVPASAWGGKGEVLEPVLDERYRPHGATCGDKPGLPAGGRRAAAAPAALHPHAGLRRGLSRASGPERPQLVHRHPDGQHVRRHPDPAAQARGEHHRQHRLVVRARW